VRALEWTVTMLSGLDHIADRFDLAVRQALRHGTRTAGSIIEHASSVGVRPSVVTSGRQPENSQRRRQRHGFAGTFDRAEQAAFARCVWNACPAPETARGFRCG
jgi:hypothetical protein